MGAEQEETGWKYLHGDVFRCAAVVCGWSLSNDVLHFRYLTN